jgi:hypothetical protein
MQPAVGHHLRIAPLPVSAAPAPACVDRAKNVVSGLPARPATPVVNGPPHKPARTSAAAPAPVPASVRPAPPGARARCRNSATSQEHGCQSLIAHSCAPMAHAPGSVSRTKSAAMKALRRHVVTTDSGNWRRLVRFNV